MQPWMSEASTFGCVKLTLVHMLPNRTNDDMVFSGHFTQGELLRSATIHLFSMLKLGTPF